MTRPAKSPRVQARTGGVAAPERSEAQQAQPTTGEQLRAAREAAGLTQRALAERLADEHQAAASWIVSLSRYEGGAQVPESGTVSRILDALAMPPADAVRVAMAHALPAEALGGLAEAYGLEAVAGELERRAGLLRELGRRMRRRHRRRQ